MENDSQGIPESPYLKNTGPNNDHHNIIINNNNNNNKEQDRFLPIANVGRIMKKVIPGNGKISKDAKETVQECVSEFISFVTGEASDKCQREKRKTINGDDIIWAITTLGFEDYIVPLKLYLSKYRKIEDEKMNIPKPQRSSSSSEQQKQQEEDYHHHHHQEHHQIVHKISYNSNPQLFPSTNLMSHHSSFVTTTDHQPFPLPFSPNSIQKQLQQQQQDQVDSVGNW